MLVLYDIVAFNAINLTATFKIHVYVTLALDRHFQCCSSCKGWSVTNFSPWLFSLSCHTRSWNCTTTSVSSWYSYIYNSTPFLLCFSFMLWAPSYFMTHKIKRFCSALVVEIMHISWICVLEFGCVSNI